MTKGAMRLSSVVCRLSSRAHPPKMTDDDGVIHLILDAFRAVSRNMPSVGCVDVMI